MDADISKHIGKCITCQERRFQHLERSEKLTPLPLCTEPNQRVHIDLFGPLKSNSGKKMVMCITGAFTKYIEVAVIPNKKSINSGRSHETPIILLSDQGKEFCNEIVENLC